MYTILAAENGICANGGGMVLMNVTWWRKRRQIESRPTIALRLEGASQVIRYRQAGNNPKGTFPLPVYVPILFTIAPSGNFRLYLVVATI